MGSPEAFNRFLKDLIDYLYDVFTGPPQIFNGFFHDSNGFFDDCDVPWRSLMKSPKISLDPLRTPIDPLRSLMDSARISMDHKGF